jgi:hypothetical protein
MKIKIVLLTIVLAFSAVGFARPKMAPAADNQATAQVKTELSQLIVKDDKEVREAITEGLSTDALAKSLTVKTADLNKDGQAEYIVVSADSSLCGALANCPNWVYRKTGSGYQLLLRTRGRELIVEKTLTHKFLNLRSVGGDTAFEGSFFKYKFDGNKYHAKACFTRTYATRKHKEKITPFKCDESES